MGMRRDGVIISVIGATGSGKSLFVKSLAENWDRVLAYDPKNEFCTQMGYEGITGKRELLERLKSATGPAKICYSGYKREDFAFFCECAFNWFRQKPAMIVVEELSGVTSSGKAADAWNRVVNQQRAYGALIVATGQRGQEIDKTIFNAATFIHICKHASAADVKYISDMTEIPAEKIPRLPLKWIQWSPAMGQIVSGKIDFTGQKSKITGKRKPKFKRLPTGKVLKIGKYGMFEGVKYK